MTNSIRKLDVDLLRVGMYVSKLDRPWLETPFLFQGFFVRTQSDIDELNRYCDFVEIDVDQSDATLRSMLQGGSGGSRSDKSATEGTHKHNSIWARIRAFFGRKVGTLPSSPTPGDFYRDTERLPDELVVARTVHSGSLGQLMNVLAEIRSGKLIAMPNLEVVIGGMVDSVLRNSSALALLTRLQEKDEYTSSHSLASSIWALVFGRHLGLDREALSAVGLGGLLLDVGKMKLPEELLKKKGELTEIERSHIHNHVGFGLELIRQAEGVDNRVLDMVATHHERYDGSGYPRGWKGNQIPVFGRIGGIVDSYSAMTSDRPYAQAVSSYDAMREFKSLADKHYQAEMVEQFIQAIGIFPAGTLVELNTGEIGVVLEEHQSTRLQPKVAVILGPEKKPLLELRIVDLRNSAGTRPTLWIERGIEPGVYDIDPAKYFL